MQNTSKINAVKEAKDIMLYYESECFSSKELYNLEVDFKNKYNNNWQYYLAETES